MERERLARLEREPIASPRFEIPAVPGPVPFDEDPPQRAVREGRAAKDVARHMLTECGFTAIEADVPMSCGVEVSFRAYDELDNAWLFDVSGGFTSTRPGLKRTDTLWKGLGKAAVLHAIDEKTPLVLLTTGAPARGSAAAQALSVVTGPGKPITAVLEMRSPTDLERLADFLRSTS